MYIKQGYLRAWILGWIRLVDALVKIFSFGILTTSLESRFLRKQARAEINKRYKF